MKKISLCLSIFICAVFLISLPLNAQTNSQRWKSMTGPWYCSYAADISIGYHGNQRVIYVADSTSNSLLKSTDEGMSWIHLPVAYPDAVACIPHRPDTVYVGVPGMGLLKSIDGGKSFEEINNGFESTLPRRLSISPHDENLIYVGCWPWTTEQPTLYRSTNGGERWFDVPPFNDNRFAVTDIVFNPRSSDTIWISGMEFGQPDDSGVWRSTDAGRTWLHIISGMDMTQIGALSVDPNQPTVLYAGTHYDIQNHFYKSTNSGDEWRLVHEQTFPVFDAAISAGQDGSVYFSTSEGILKSRDGCNSWEWRNAGMFDRYVLSLSIDQLCPDIIYAGTWASFYRSLDMAAQWQERTNGMEIVRVRGVDIRDSELLTISNNEFNASSVINRSTTSGSAWHVLLRNEKNHQDYHFSGRTIVRNYAHSDIILAGGRRISEDEEWEKYVIRSSDGGLTWRRVLSDGLYVLRPLHVNDIGFDPREPSIAFAVTDYIDDKPHNIFRSGDMGQSWTAQHSIPGDIQCLQFDPHSGSPSQVIYSAGLSVGVIKTTDSGASWNNTSLSGIDAFGLALDPHRSNVLYAGTSSGVYKTTDGGTNWSFLSNSPLSKIDWLLVHPITANTIYAVASNNRKVYKSVDAGENWNEISDGLPNTFTHRVRLDPTSPNIIYTASDSGVYSIPHIWTGEIAANATWKSGENYLVEGNLTIPEGKTLTIEPGAKVKLYDGAGIYAYGTLRAEGSTINPIIFEKNSENRWYGIIINKQNNSIIKHCKISGAQFGVAYIGLEDKIYPSLSNSEIRDCTEGIRLYGNIQYKMDHPIKQNLIENCDYGIVIYHTAAEDPSRVENRPRFDLNAIKSCSKNGVWAARSRPAFYRNQITNNGEEGVILTDAGNAEFGQKQTPGYNTIANNNGEWQVRVSYSNPLIGLVDDEKLCNPIAGGLNGIFHNQDYAKRIMAVGEGTLVQADKTLWGWPIDPKWFENDGKAIILARCPIDPQGPREEQLLISAASKRAEGLYEQAIAAYDSLLEYYPYTTQAAAAVSGCADTYSEYAEATGDSSLKQAKIDYLEEQAEFHANPDVKVVANLYLARE